MIEGDVTLLLSRSAADALATGGDLLPVYAMVNTLGSFPRVASVRFAIDGQQVPTVAGTDLSQPLKPRWDLIKEGD